MRAIHGALAATTLPSRRTASDVWIALIAVLSCMPTSIAEELVIEAETAKDNEKK
jgi:hypothetical protein